MGIEAQNKCLYSPWKDSSRKTLISWDPCRIHFACAGLLGVAFVLHGNLSSLCERRGCRFCLAQLITELGKQLNNWHFLRVGGK